MQPTYDPSWQCKTCRRSIQPICEKRQKTQCPIPWSLKCEFLDLQFAHRLRRKGIPIRQFYGAVKKTRLKPWYSVHAPSAQ